MNILIAEDDPVSAIAIEGLLSGLGHTVIVARDGRQAWKLWQEAMPPIVVLDWMMPEIDGIEVCRLIRSKKSSHYTCIIMLTAKREREDRIMALKAGADVFLTKPINRDELVARIQVAERILKMEQSADLKAA